MIRRLINDLLALFKGALECVRLFTPSTPEARAVFQKFAEKKEESVDEEETRFLAAKDAAESMTLDSLIGISDDFNLGYDIRDGMFEIMVKIPMEKLEANV